jgi:hypothetical protein
VEQARSGALQHLSGVQVAVRIVPLFKTPHPLNRLPFELSRDSNLSAELRYHCWSENALATITPAKRSGSGLGEKLFRKRQEWLDLPVWISSILIRS